MWVLIRCCLNPLGQGCLAVRNLVARNPEFLETFLDAGAEQILRDAGKYQVRPPCG